MLLRGWVGCLIVIVGAALVLALPPAPSALTGPAIHARPEVVELTDPFPIRRVFVSSESLPKALAKLSSPVTRMPLSDFETLVRSAHQRQTALAPRLVEAEYFARLSDAGLSGRAIWRVANPAGTRSFPFVGWGVALGGIQDDQGKAVLISGGMLPLSGRGEETFRLEWSAATRQEGNTLRSEIAFPTSPIASLELDLPAEVELSASVPVSGPMPNAGAGRQLRKLLFANTPRITWQATNRTPAEANPPLAASRITRLEFLPGMVLFEEEWQVNSIRGTPAEVILTVDPRLRLAGMTQDQTIRQKFPEAGPLKFTLTGYAVSPEGQTEPWSLPCSRLAGAILEQDLFEVRVRPGVEWMGADPGDYLPKPMPSMPTPDDSPRFAFLATAGAHRPPAVFVKPATMAFTSSDDITLSLSNMKLVGQFRLIVTKGPLESVAFHVPPGFQLQRAEQIPDDPALRFTGETVFLERAAMTGETIELRVELTGPRPAPGHTTAFPRLELRQATEREGSFTVQHSGLERVQFTIPTPLSIGAANRWRFPFRGRMPNGLFSLNPATPSEAPPPLPPASPEVVLPEDVRHSTVTLVTAVERDGQVSHTLRGWQEPTSARSWFLDLPENAELREVRIGGKAWDLGVRQLPAFPVRTAWEVRWYEPRSLGFWPTMLSTPVLNLDGLTTTHTLSAEYRMISEGWVVSQGFVTLLGWLLGILSVAGLLGLTRWPRSAKVVQLAWPLLLLGVWVFNPESLLPALRPALLGAVAVGLVTLLRDRRILAVLVLSASTITGVAQSPEPTVVLITETKAGWQALVSETLRDRLQPKPDPRPVVEGVELFGEATTPTRAKFDAKILLRSPTAEEQEFTLPFAGVRLESLRLDDQPAYPTATVNGYRILVRGQGSHTIYATFQVSTTTTNSRREVTFQIPKHPQCRLKFTAPGSQPTLEAVGRRGMQVRDVTATSTQILAELGDSGEVRIQYPSGEVVPANKNLTVREAYLWDLKDHRASLLAGYQFAFENGTTDRLTLEFPESLEPSPPSLRLGDGQLQPASTWAKSLTLTPAKDGLRTWEIQFAQPPTERAMIFVLFRHRDGATLQPKLFFPRWRDVRIMESLAGIRLTGMKLEAIDRTGWIDFPAEDFQRRNTAYPGWEMDRLAPNRVFQRFGDSRADLRPTLSLAEESIAVQSETRFSWQGIPEVDTQFAITHPNLAITHHFAVPETWRLTELRGPDVLSWRQTAGHVQVWYARPTRQTSFVLTAQPGLARLENPGPQSLPLVSLPGVGNATIRVRPPLGWGIQVPAQKGVARRADSTQDETTLTVDGTLNALALNFTAPVPERPRPVSVPTTSVSPKPTPTPVEAAPPTPPTVVSEGMPWWVKAGWPAAWLLILLMRRRGLSTPETLSAGGLFASLLAGWQTPLGLLFGFAGLVGLAWRALRFSRRWFAWLFR
ncbi:MAG: hypothetical protein ACRC8S_04525 [Fimbriiglobus sp.]